MIKLDAGLWTLDFFYMSLQCFWIYDIQIWQGHGFTLKKQSIGYDMIQCVGYFEVLGIIALDAALWTLGIFSLAISL